MKKFMNSDKHTILFHVVQYVQSDIDGDNSEETSSRFKPGVAFCFSVVAVCLRLQWAP